MKWIGPLFRNGGGWDAFVAYEDGLWYVDKDEPIEVGKGKSGIMLLPILQKGYGENYSTQIVILRQGLESHSQNPDLAYEFPFSVPVLTAYKIMPNWSSDAVSWLEYIVTDKEIALEIYDACYSSVTNQSVRQKTVRFINRWSNERGFQFVRPKC